MSPAPHATLGPPSNHWTHTPLHGFNLTRCTPGPSLTLPTSTSPITISPSKSALIVIDMQNFFLSLPFGRSQGAGHTAQENLIKHAIPAARKAGIRIVWCNWGLTEEEVNEMPPGVVMAFGFEQVVGGEEGEVKDPFAEVQSSQQTTSQENGNAEPETQKEKLSFSATDPALETNNKPHRIYKGLGGSGGAVTLPTGSTIDAGRLLMRDTWNASLHPPLDTIYTSSQSHPLPDIWIHKNRMSGLWGSTTPLQSFLENHGITTLLFSGVNTDQCVAGTLTDAYSKGYDCILLRDGCGTTSPGFAQKAVEWNVERCYGFVLGCEDFALAVEGMEGGG